MDSMNSLFKAKKIKQYVSYNKTAKSMETKYENLQFMQPSGQNNVAKPQNSGLIMGYANVLSANPESCGFTVRSGYTKSTGCIPKSAFKPYTHGVSSSVNKKDSN